MLIGKVIGTLTPAVVYEGLQSVPMLLVQPLNKEKNNDGDRIVCADSTRMAGRNEIIYYEASREAALALEPWFVPVDHTIIGIIDDIQLSPEAEE